MSKIYSKAEYVFSCLGTDPAVGKYLEYAIQLASSLSAQGSKSLLQKAQLRLFAEIFVNLSYWKRLWIYQEVLLGNGGLMLMAE